MQPVPELCPQVPLQDKDNEFSYVSEEFVAQKYKKIRLNESSKPNTNDSSRVFTLKIYMNVWMYIHIDGYGYMEVITDGKIQLLHRLVWDKLEIKVDGGADSNVHLLKSLPPSIL